MARPGNETTGSMTFYTVYDGKIVCRVPEGTEGASSRILTAGKNEGKTVFEKTYTSLSGYITGGGIVKKEFGTKKVKEIHIRLDDDAVLQLPMTMLTPFAQVLGNIDPESEVKFSVYKNKAGKTGMNVSQDGKQLEWEHTKDHPNGLPQPVYKQSLEKWDFDDHDAFFIDKITNFFANFSDSPAEVLSSNGFVHSEDIPF